MGQYTKKSPLLLPHPWCLSRIMLKSHAVSSLLDPTRRSVPLLLLFGHLPDSICWRWRDVHSQCACQILDLHSQKQWSVGDLFHLLLNEFIFSGLLEIFGLSNLVHKTQNLPTGAATTDVAKRKVEADHLWQGLEINKSKWRYILLFNLYDEPLSRHCMTLAKCETWQRWVESQSSLGT